MKTKFFKKMNIIMTIVLLLGITLTTSAFVATSSSYSLESDSLNTGGLLSTSTNYQIEDTVGEVGTGTTTSTTYVTLAGYQQMQETHLSVSVGSDIVMTPLTLTQSSGVGSTTWTIITDNVAGYSATVYVTVSDACVDLDGGGAVDALCNTGDGDSFRDISTTKHTWDVDNEYSFGWSAHGDDVTGFGTDTDCVAEVNVPSAGLLWQGFHGATAYQIASSATRTSPTGVATIMCVASEQDTVFAPSGTYYATTTITVITL